MKRAKRKKERNKNEEEKQMPPFFSLAPRKTT
jgi:hypothetical protein